MDPKELKKLAKACREAGIKHFKAPDGTEFTLSEEAPISPYKRRKAAIKGESAPIVDNAPISTSGDWDSLSDEQKLFYSITDAGFLDPEQKEKAN